MQRNAKDVLVDSMSYTECPRWHNGELWFSDFYSHCVYSMNVHGEVQSRCRVPGQPSGIGFLPDGNALVVSMKDRRLLRLSSDGRLRVHADLSKLAPWHLNDMAVDSEGRAWVGNFGFDLMAGADMAGTCLIRVDPDGHAERVASDLLFPNGTVITPDGSTLIVAESFGQRLTAFDITSGGQLENRRAWAQLGEAPTHVDLHAFIADARFVPDGMCMDAEGAIWVADALGGRVARIGPGGEILEQITADDQGIFACMLGGPQGSTLFLCCAPSFSESERQYTRDAEIRRIDVRVPHAGLP